MASSKNGLATLCYKSNHIMYNIVTISKSARVTQTALFSVSLDPVETLCSVTQHVVSLIRTDLTSMHCFVF
jgi:hypothetical protein